MNVSFLLTNKNSLRQRTNWKFSIWASSKELQLLTHMHFMNFKGLLSGGFCCYCFLLCDATSSMYLLRVRQWKVPKHADENFIATSLHKKLHFPSIHPFTLLILNKHRLTSSYMEIRIKWIQMDLSLRNGSSSKKLESLFLTELRKCVSFKLPSQPRKNLFLS
jgi:hypothetical protein